MSFLPAKYVNIKCIFCEFVYVLVCWPQRVPWGNGLLPWCEVRYLTLCNQLSMLHALTQTT